ncbi:MAG: metalloregulator ArsR/SmtB family transcription factor [Gammaproteobacteria bacterium]|nr:metalloregulator ArsR/SmtB family transcription factor [Gammaproteobacteria bacterium]
MKLDFDSAAILLAQLGNPTRLRIVRLLVEAGSEGMAVGEVQRELAIPASTLSHHISHLREARLVRQQRSSTILNCVVDYKKIDSIVRFLTEECCVRARSSHNKRRRVA